MLQEGERVPELEAPLHDGGVFSTRSGRPYILYFYPKDFTPG